MTILAINDRKVYKYCSHCQCYSYDKGKGLCVNGFCDNVSDEGEGDDV